MLGKRGKAGCVPLGGLTVFSTRVASWSFPRAGFDPCYEHLKIQPTTGSKLEGRVQKATQGANLPFCPLHPKGPDYLIITR